jgi:hypothetical protein
MRYSYVLHIPQHHNSFLDVKYRWATFLGELVKPIADKYPELLFWCSFYDTFFRFRVHSESQEVHNFILERINNFGLEFNAAEENDAILSSDLGASRFIEQALGANAINRRADLVLKFLCSTVRLYLDGLVKIDNLHWQYRTTPDDQNPLGNNFESLAHLMANISQFEFDVFATAGTAWRQTPFPLRIRCRL